MNKILSSCLLIISYLTTYYAHDIHVSVSDIVFKTDNLELTIKTYLDDLQIATGLEPGKAIPEGYSSAESLIEKYIKENIQLYINGEEILLQSTEIDASNDAVWISILIENVKPTSIKTLKMNSTFLTKVYDDQTNIVNIKKEGIREVFSLSGKKTSFTYSF